MAGRFTGQSIERVEDDRLLRGRGAFVGGLRRDGMAHAVFVRSPHAHARIRSVDVTRARARPGVLAVYTGDDIASAMVSPMVLVGPPALKVAPFWPVARDKVRFVGDPVAVVVATTEAIAPDARDLVVVDYEPLPAVTDIDTALDDRAAALWDELGDNVAIREQQEWGDVESAFAQAATVVRRRFVQHRVTHAPMEPRAAVASYDPATGRLHYDASHKRPHPLKLALSTMLGIPFPDVHVRAGDIGGGFGSKGQITRDDVALCAAAKLFGRPIKWVETRSENLAVAGHARDETLDVEAAVDGDGSVLGLRVAMRLGAGAYPMLPFPASFFATLVKMLLPNAYRIAAYRFDSTAVYTNKASYISYRGPWAVETWVREAMLDAIARELGISPEEVRGRNLYAAPDLPARTTTGVTLDGISARETLDRAVELLDLDKLRAKQREARAQGRLLGVGLATFVEIAPGPPDFAPLVGFDLPSETAWARIEPTGHLTISTWQVTQGQGHETTLAQAAADELGVPVENVRIEVDADTGAVDILRYLVVEDCGALVNPAVVDGQITGGVAQGIAQVLHERLHYDDDGQLLTASLADYLVPSAADLPPIEIEHLQLGPYADVPRGVGEGGMIGAPAALCNAVSDALAPFGVEVDVQHLSPERVRAMITRR